MSGRLKPSLETSTTHNPPRKRIGAGHPPGFKQQAKQLTEKINAKVDIKRSVSGKGSIVIGFSNDNEFERIIAKLNNL